MYFINLLIYIYLGILIIRFLLEWFNANDRNILTQWVVKIAKPVVYPLEKCLPKHGKINWACLAGILIISLLQHLLIAWLILKNWPHAGGLIIWSIGSLLALTSRILFWAIFIHAILTWVAMFNGKVATPSLFLHDLTQPLLRPIQKILPTLGGIDFSPLVAMLLLSLINTLLIRQIIYFGVGLIF